MLELVVPDLRATRRLQQQEGTFYWSRCFGTVLRRHGWLSVRRTSDPQDADALGVLCRGVDPEQAPRHRAQVLEGPLGDEVLRRLGLSAERGEAGLLELEGAVNGELFLPEIRAKGQRPGTGGIVFDDTRAAWRTGPLAVTWLDGEGWEPVLAGKDPASGRSGAIAVRRGSTLVLGVALLDVCARWLATPPLRDPFGGYERQMDPSLPAQIAAFVVGHGEDHGCFQLRADRWPAGSRAAFTVRHDYDRSADPETLADLVGFYARTGVKASIGFLPELLELRTIDLFIDGGHEPQGHLVAKDRPGLRQDLEDLSAAAGAPIRGVTIHGGPSGHGFRGQTHFERLDDLGIVYCEAFGPRSGVGGAICRVHGGVPDASTLLASPRHHSLDGSTHPEDHRLDDLARRLPAALDRGEHVIVMNHPDVHLPELKALIAGLDLDRVWCATLVDVMAWLRDVHHGSRVRRVGTQLELTFPQPLPHDLEVTCGTARTPVPAGTTRSLHGPG